MTIHLIHLSLLKDIAIYKSDPIPYNLKDKIYNL